MSAKPENHADAAPLYSGEASSSSEPLRKPCVIMDSMSPRAVDDLDMDCRSRARADTLQTTKFTTDVVRMPKMSISRTWTTLTLENTLLYIAFSFETTAMMASDASVHPSLTDG